MEASSGFITDGLAATSDENGNCLGVGAFFDLDNFIVRGTEGELFDASGLS
jgi:hypothetical protein